MVELDAPPDTPTSQASNALSEKLQKQQIHHHCVQLQKCGLELFGCSAGLIAREKLGRNVVRDLPQTCSAAPLFARSRVVLPTIPDIGHFYAVLMLGPVADRVMVRQQSEFLHDVFEHA